MPPLSQPLFTALMIISTAMVQLLMQLVLDRVTPPRSWSGVSLAIQRLAVTVAAISVLMIGHLGQVAIWAVRYWSWGTGRLRELLLLLAGELHHGRGQRTRTLVDTSHGRSDRIRARHADVRVVDGAPGRAHPARRKPSPANWRPLLQLTHRATENPLAFERQGRGPRILTGSTAPAVPQTEATAAPAPARKRHRAISGSILRSRSIDPGMSSTRPLRMEVSA